MKGLFFGSRTLWVFGSGFFVSFVVVRVRLIIC